jgi:uracil-DNA glycosylase
MLSKRTPAMLANCPPTYLRDELCILDPKVIVAFGDESWNALFSVRDTEFERIILDGPAWRAKIQIGKRVREVFWLPHPRWYRRWWAGHEALVRNLMEKPASA